MRLGRSDIKGIVGIVPTPATPDAASWKSGNTINFRETVKMVEAVAGGGVDILMTTGTFGECATLTEEELLGFVACVVETTKKRAPVFAGVTTLNTRDTVARGRKLLERGADGLFLGRPMWLPLDDKGILRFYTDMAEAFPGVPLVVYDNPGPFKGKIGTELYKALAKIPEVVASKHVGGPALETDVMAVGDQIALLPLEMDWYDIVHKHPDRVPACWSGNVACGPASIVALRRAIQARDWTNAKRISDRIVWALHPQLGGDMARFMSYSIPIGHGRFRTAGLFDPGPTRPPYIDAPADLIAGGEETGRRFAQLQKEFAAEAVAG